MKGLLPVLELLEIHTDGKKNYYCLKLIELIKSGKFKNFIFVEKHVRDNSIYFLEIDERGLLEIIDVEDFASFLEESFANYCKNILKLSVPIFCIFDMYTLEFIADKINNLTNHKSYM